MPEESIQEQLTPKRSLAERGGPNTPKKIKLSYENFNSLIKLEGIIKELSIELRLRNISDEREAKISNKTVLNYHADGFDKNSQGVRIIFFDKMVKKWEDELFVSKK